MMVYLCRWPNGDISFVGAANKRDVAIALDEVGSATEEMLTPAKNFMVHFGLGDDGELAWEGFGEHTEQMMWTVYPILRQELERQNWPDAYTTEQRKAIAKAVSAERERMDESAYTRNPTAQQMADVSDTVWDSYRDESA